MSRRTARLVAAGLWTFGVTSLVMLAVNLDATGLVMLGMGLASVVTATWINRGTATDAAPAASASEEPKPSDSSASAP